MGTARYMDTNSEEQIEKLRENKKAIATKKLRVD